VLHVTLVCVCRIGRYSARLPNRRGRVASGTPQRSATSRALHVIDIAGPSVFEWPLISSDDRLAPVATRRELIRTVLARLPSTATTVAYPDHPFLLEPPDILSARNGALTAMFILGRRERIGSGRHSLARYLLTRFALPRHATVILLTEDLNTVDIGGDGPVDAVRPVDGNRLRLDAEPLQNLWNIATEELRQAHFDRFSEAWESEVRTREEVQGRRSYGVSTMRMHELANQSAADYRPRLEATRYADDSSPIAAIYGADSEQRVSVDSHRRSPQSRLRSDIASACQRAVTAGGLFSWPRRNVGQLLQRWLW